MRGLPIFSIPKEGCFKARSYAGVQQSLYGQRAAGVVTDYFSDPREKEGAKESGGRCFS